MRPASDGRPLRAHLEAVAKQIGREPDSLAAANEKPPLELAYIEGWFYELNSSRTGNGFGGVHRFTYSEIRAWADLTGRRMTPQELECLLMLDGLFVQTITAKEDENG